MLGSDQEAVSWVYYSWDEGQSLHKLDLQVKEKMMIHSIRSDPERSGLSFLVIGDTGAQKRGVVVTISFEDLFPRVCSVEEDYVTSKINVECILGRRLEVRKKIASRKCRNPEAHDQRVRQAVCPCTQ